MPHPLIPGPKFHNAATIGSFSSDNISPQQFVKMIVLDVISDPHIIAYNKRFDWETKKISNVNLSNSLPRNTIIAKFLMGNQPPMFVFPFFPSHLALPCKAGELVWVFFENPTSVSSEIAYWMCRVTDFHYVDDVNHTHAPRVLEPSFKETKLDDSEPWYELRNGLVKILDVEGNRKTDPFNTYLDHTDSKDDLVEDIFEKIVLESDAGAMTNYEAVPRFRKRPGDIALEGSNNTLIVLGTDRSGQISSYYTGSNNVAYPEKTPGDAKEYAGSIDMVTGRGQTPRTMGGIAETTSIFGSSNKKRGPVLKTEIAKHSNVLSGSEGDPDFESDRSRVLISQKMMPDYKFGLSDYNSQFSDPPIYDSYFGDSAVVIKSDKVRLIARSDVEIIVTDYNTDFSPTGEVIKSEKKDLSSFASIVIKRNGDIVFTPSQKGVIKMGGETADKAILCTDVQAINNEGSISAAPIFTTGNDVVGTNRTGQGTFAKKILVVG